MQHFFVSVALNENLQIMKNIKHTFTTLLLLLMLSTVAFAQTQKPDNKAVFYGENDEWVPSSYSIYTYYDDVDSSIEEYYTWNPSASKWNNDFVARTKYRPDGRPLVQIAKAPRPSPVNFENLFKTEFEYAETMVDGELLVEDTLRANYQWNSASRNWSFWYQYATEVADGQKSSTVASWASADTARETQRTDYNYENGVHVSTNYLNKNLTNGVWEPQSHSRITYVNGTDNISETEVYDYENGAYSSLTYKEVYSYTDFDEIEKVERYDYDQNSETFTLSIVYDYTYDAKENLLELVIHSVLTDGSYVKDYKEEYTYPEIGAVNEKGNVPVVIYLNPTRGMVTFENASEIKTAAVMDMTGKEIAKYRKEDIQSGIDLTGNAPGTYVLLENYDDGTLGRKKLILSAH